MKKNILYLIFILLFQSCSIVIPYKDLPEPRGEYIIGTDIFELEDTSREEWFTDRLDDYRKIVIHVWYPAIEKSNELYPYIDYADLRIPAIANRLEISNNFIKNSAKIQTNSYFKAKPVNDEFPVIIFSHGLGGTKIQNSINIEDLVSNGYVVFAIDHPYDANITIFSDNTIANFDSFLPDDVSEEEFWNVRLPQITTRAQDISFLIDQLEILKQQGYFVGKVSDLNRIGIFGHSFGGGTAIISSFLDKRLSACINLDGWLEPVPDNIINSGIKIPFCFIGQIQNNWDGAPYNEQKLYSFHKNNSNSYIIEIKDTKHFDFSDTPYFNRITRLFGISGKEGKNITLDLNKTITGFFDLHLKNHTNKWYENLESQYNIILRVSDK